MKNNKAVEAKDRSAKIYLRMATVFIAVFSTIYLLSIFISALNF